MRKRRMKKVTPFTMPVVPHVSHNGSTTACHHTHGQGTAMRRKKGSDLRSRGLVSEEIAERASGLSAWLGRERAHIVTVGRGRNEEEQEDL